MRVFGLLSFLLFLPLLASAHGGDQRILDNKYIVSLSRAPYTPITGEEAQMTLFFFDIAKDRLIDKRIMANVRIAKLGEADSERQNYLFEQKNLLITGGSLDLPFAFSEPGLHEVFVEFAIESAPAKIYRPDDFVVDVREPAEEFKVPVPWDLMALSFATGIAAVFLAQDIRKRLQGA